jgi:hypothetical protein
MAPIHILADADAEIVQDEPVDRAGQAVGAVVEILGVDAAARQRRGAIAFAETVGDAVLRRRQPGNQHADSR